MDEIELDIVEQIYSCASGLRPWIVIESATGEIVDSVDVIHEFFRTLKLEGSRRIDTTRDAPMGGRREVKLRRRG